MNGDGLSLRQALEDYAEASGQHRAAAATDEEFAAGAFIGCRCGALVLPDYNAHMLRAGLAAFCQGKDLPEASVPVALRLVANGLSCGLEELETLLRALTT